MKNENMLNVKKIFEEQPNVKQKIIEFNPLLSELSGFSYGIESEFPQEYQ